MASEQHEESGLVLGLDVASPVVHDVDLVAVGVVGSQTPLLGAVATVDRLLGGAVERMRREPVASAGQARLIAGAAGFRAPRVLLLWLGGEEALGVDALSDAASRAVREALAVGARTVGFAPGLHDAGVKKLPVEDVARAVATGARRAFAEAARSGRDLGFRLEVSEANRALAQTGLSWRP